ncbi:MAG: hypothetical protein KF799_03925 [Bdellovibrionales bacterium]|nr:hypothetical protein [Bdellovibrionales bacterium]
MFKNIFVILATSLALAACTKKAPENDNTINYGLRTNLKALDPEQGSETSANEIIPNIFETLFEYHYLKRPVVLQPLLAEAMPTVSKDGRTYTIKIKKGIRFQDSEVFPDGKGREVKAQDFIYSWKRIADPRNKGEGWWIFDGKIEGINDWNAKLAKGGKPEEVNEAFNAPISGLQAPDDYTIVIKLAKPFYQLNNVLAMPFASVVPKEAVDKYGEEFMNHPVGTGPYKFESWIRGNKVTLVRNPNWHGGTYPNEGAPGDQEAGLLADAGKPLPFADKLVFHEIPEAQPRWLNLMKGALDFGGIPKDNFDNTITDGKLKPEMVSKGMKLWTFPSLEVVYIGFNMADPLLGKNLELRRALSLAYDGQTARKKFYNDRATIAMSPLSPDIDGYDAKFVNPWKEFNVEKAKEHLKKAGYPEGKGLPAIEYNISGSSTDRQMGEYVQQQFQKIGVQVNIISSSWPQFIERLNQKKAQMFGIAWVADYPDQGNMLQTLYSKSAAPGPNNSNYNSKEFDALFEQSEKIPPGPARIALFHKMRDQFVKDVPWIPTVHRLNDIIYQGWINNLKRHDIIRNSYKYIRVDQAKKAELKAKL